MSGKEVLSHAIEGIRQRSKSAAAVEMKGIFYSGADIAIQNECDKVKLYRIIVVPHEREIQIPDAAST